MKISEVLLKEYETGNIGKPGRVTTPGSTTATQKFPVQNKAPAAAPVDDGGYDAMGNVTTGMPSASPTAVAAPAPAQAGMSKWPTTADEIKAFQKSQGLKADGLIGGKTMTALQKSGATPPPGFKPVGAKAPAAKPAAKPAADPSLDPYDPNKDTNVKMTPQADIARAELDAQKKQVIGGALPAAPAPAPAPAQTTAAAPASANISSADAAIRAGQNIGGAVARDATDKNALADFQRLAGMTPTVNKTDQKATPNVPPGLASATDLSQNAPGVSPEVAAAQAASQQSGTGQAAQPSTAGASASYAAPATPVTSTSGQPVKSGTGGNVTTRSADEIAWSQKQGPMGPQPGNVYPGEGNWDPRTGRSTAQQAQADKNLQGVKNFFGFGKKEAPADTMPTADQNASSSYGGAMKEADDALLATIRSIR